MERNSCFSEIIVKIEILFKLMLIKILYNIHSQATEEMYNKCVAISFQEAVIYIIYIHNFRLENDYLLIIY